ncbi:TPA: head-tail connector protein [Bacillus pacificus]
MDELIEKLKSHIHWEEGMDDSLLSFYLTNAQRYVQNATGSQIEYLVIMVAGIMYEYRVSEKELEQALNALTPFFVQEVFIDVEETDK